MKNSPFLPYSAATTACTYSIREMNVKNKDKRVYCHSQCLSRKEGNIYRLTESNSWNGCKDGNAAWQQVEEKKKNA